MKKLLVTLVPVVLVGTLVGAATAPVAVAAPRPADRTVYIERTFAQDLADHLGRARLTQLYGLLDELIALPPHEDAPTQSEDLESVR